MATYLRMTEVNQCRGKTVHGLSATTVSKKSRQNTTGAKESTPLKSCMKSESRSNSLAQTSKTKSKSRSSRDSPAKKNVNFKQESK
jgi:hypothetical protein